MRAVRRAAHAAPHEPVRRSRTCPPGERLADVEVPVRGGYREPAARASQRAPVGAAWPKNAARPCRRRGRARRASCAAARAARCSPWRRALGVDERTARRCGGAVVDAARPHASAARAHPSAARSGAACAEASTSAPASSAMAARGATERNDAGLFLTAASSSSIRSGRRTRARDLRRRARTGSGACAWRERCAGGVLRPRAYAGSSMSARLARPHRRACSRASTRRSARPSRTATGRCSILAGAGSGKTRVLTHRIAYLVRTGRARAGEILAITFTNKAAQEMRERVELLLGRRTRAMWVMTFHAACARMLRAEAPRLGYTRQFTIYDQADARRLVKRCLDELGVDTKRFTPARGPAPDLRREEQAARRRRLPPARRLATSSRPSPTSTSSTSASCTA